MRVRELSLVSLLGLGLGLALLGSAGCLAPPPPGANCGAGGLCSPGQQCNADNKTCEMVIEGMPPPRVEPPPSDGLDTLLDVSPPIATNNPEARGDTNART
jgi:hypothetical protein